MIRATFEANFASFVEACTQADIKLASFQSNAGKVESSLTKMANSLQGTAMIQQATLMASAVEKIGGVSTLTSSELQRFGAQAAEAIEKMQKTGLSVPKNLQDIATAADQAGKSFLDLDNTAKSAFSQLTAGVTAGSLLASGIQKVGDVAVSAVKGTVAFFAESVRASEALEQAQARLTGAVTASGHAADGSLEAFKTLSDGIARTSTTSKAAALDMEARFVQLGQVSQANMAGATQAALDLSAGLGVDLDSAVTLISKALEGNSTSLKRMGIDLDGARVKAEGANYIFGALNERFGGQAALQAETYAGEIARIGNAWELLKAKVGDVVTQDPLIVATLRHATDSLKELASSESKGGAAFTTQAAQLSESVINTGQILPAFIAKLNEAAEAENNLALEHGLTAAAIKRSAGAFSGLVAPVDTFSAASVKLTEEQKASNKAFEDSVAIRAGFTAQQKGWIETNISEGLSAKETADFLHLNEAAVEAFAKAHQKASEAAKEFAKSEQSVNDQLSGTDWDGSVDSALKLGVSIHDASVYFGESEGAVKKHKDAIDTWAKVIQLEASPSVEQFSGALQKLGVLSFDDINLAKARAAVGQLEASAYQGVSEEINKFGTVVKIVMPQVLQDHQQWLKELDELSSAFAQLSQVAGGAFGGIAKELGNIISSVNLAEKSVEAFYAAKTTSGKAAAVVGGIGAVAQATSGGGAGALFGGAITGGEIGAQIAGPVGAVFGAVGGAIIGAIRDLNIGGPSKDELKTRDIRSDAFQPLGGLSSSYTLNAQTGQYEKSTAGIQASEDALTQLGVSAQQAQTLVARALDAKTPAAFAAAMKPVNDAITLNARLQGDVTSLTSLVGAFENAGHVLPASMLTTLQTLAKMPALTDAERSSLKGLIDSAAPDFESLESKAAGLGISLGALGPKFSQGDLNQKANDLASTFADLENAGADVGGITQAAAAKFGDLVDAALAAGSTLPDSIKPYVEDLFNTGQLTDTAGQKITDITKLAFTNTPVKNGLDDINAGFSDLQDTLTNGVPKALSALLASIPSNPFAGWTIPGVPTGVSVPGHAGGGFAAPGWALVGERGPELVNFPSGGGNVLTADQTRAALAGSGGGQSTTVVIEMDGKEIARSTTKHQTNDLRLRARMRAA